MAFRALSTRLSSKTTRTSAPRHWAEPLARRLNTYNGMPIHNSQWIVDPTHRPPGELPNSRHYAGQASTPGPSNVFWLSRRLPRSTTTDLATSVAAFPAVAAADAPAASTASMVTTAVTLTTTVVAVVAAGLLQWWQRQRWLPQWSPPLLEPQPPAPPRWRGIGQRCQPRFCLLGPTCPGPPPFQPALVPSLSGQAQSPAAVSTQAAGVPVPSQDFNHGVKSQAAQSQAPAPVLATQQPVADATQALPTGLGAPRCHCS